MKLFHSRKDGNGSMFSMRIEYFGSRDRYSPGYVWIDVAKQVGEKSFDWQNRQTFKLGADDIIHILPRLRAKLPQISLFHQWNGNTKTITFKRHVVKDENNNSRAAYFLYINRDLAFHFDWDEIYAFCSLLEYALPKITGFDVPRRRTESFSIEEQQTQSIDASKEESVQPEADTELKETSLDDDFSSDFEI